MQNGSICFFIQLHLELFWFTSWQDCTDKTYFSKSYLSFSRYMYKICYVNYNFSLMLELFTLHKFV